LCQWFNSRLALKGLKDLGECFLPELGELRLLNTVNLAEGVDEMWN